MANTVLKLKRTSVAGRTPNTTNISNTQYIPAGGLALNMTDGILYSSDGTNSIAIGANNVTIRASTNFYAGNSTVNTAITGNQIRVGNSTVNAVVNSTVIFVGNSTVNASINSTATFSIVGHMNEQTLKFDYTIPADRNCMVAGPYTINTSVTLTVANGGRFVVV